MKNIKKITLFILVVAFIASCPMEYAQAAGGLKELDSEKTYKSYDFTGDGKNDSLKYVYEGRNVDHEARMFIYLNGKKLQRVDLAKGGEAFVWQVSKKRSYLLITGYGFGCSVLNVYSYKNKRFKQIGIDEKQQSPLDYVTPYKANKNTLTVKNEAGSHQRIFGDNKPSFIVKYKLQGGKLKMVSRYASITGKKVFKAAKTFKTSSSATKDNTKGVKVKKGAKVTMKKMYVYYKKYKSGNKTNYSAECKYQISVNGKSGWIKDSLDWDNVLLN